MEGLALSIQKNDISVISGVMQDELEAFEFVYGRTGVKYEAPSGVHDDCVNSLALANAILIKPKGGFTGMTSY